MQIREVVRDRPRDLELSILSEDTVGVVSEDADDLLAPGGKEGLREVLLGVALVAVDEGVAESVLGDGKSEADSAILDTDLRGTSSIVHQTLHCLSSSKIQDLPCRSPPHPSIPRG